MTNSLDPQLLDNNVSSQSHTAAASCKPIHRNKFLNYVWPVYHHELAKFLGLTILMFCILGIQNLIRAMKDSVINTLIGTETISFLKFWGVMPAAFLIAIVYVKLINVMKSENIFYLIMSVFLSFFLLFAFYLFPNYQSLHLSTETTIILIKNYPNLKWFILLLSNWSFSLFYIIAELWPNAVFALLFWQFVNRITTIDQSKRFYPLFGLLGQTGLYLSGMFLSNLAILNVKFCQLCGLDYNNESVASIQLVISVVTILGLVGLLTFWVLNRYIVEPHIVQNLQFQMKKQKLSLKESIKLVVNSRYIRLIALLLICYGVAINLVEGPWKARAADIYTTPTEFAAFVGNYLSYTGILTIILVFIGSNVVRHFGWLAAALITPLMVLVTGLTFFLVANFDSVAAFMMLSFSFNNPLMLAIIIGAIQNVLSKSTKYTLYDSTKEMAYVPLTENLKTRGKAAADMLGTKLGKSTSALLQSMIFIVLPTATYKSISVFLMVVFTVICIIWIWTVVQLNKEYQLACLANDEHE